MISSPRKEMADSIDILGSLEPYCDDSIAVTDKEIITKLHDMFRDDFIFGTVLLDGKEVKVKPFPYNRAVIDHLPDWFNGLSEKFVHIITREVKENNRKTARKIREFRSERALRIHWIKPIIENCSDRRIRRFKCLEYSGREREYFWFNQGYMVIVEFLNPDVALITGFCVDQDNQAYYLRKYQDRIK